ncbi:MAG: tRNA 2-thiouridine(34) synthase MnmA [Acidaminococcaceae bacterium]
MLKDKTVAIAMSGGVDSSVAAALLLQKGYKVIGITMRLWVDKNADISVEQSESPEKDAAIVAKLLGIEHHIIDFNDFFRKNVVEYFLDEYKAGRTPNPCVYCNKKVKFGLLYDKARELGADYLATGHYAAIMEDSEGFKRVAQAKNVAKDQSYVLYHLNQEQLKHVIFPLGEYDKTQVRQMAKEFNLPVFNKKDSQDICFIPDNDYHRFLNSFFVEKKGNVIDSQGQILGIHHGISHYTIGQRKGLGIAAAAPLYVMEIDAEKNIVVLGGAEESLRDGMIVNDVIFSDGLPLKEKKSVRVKIRYNAKPVEAVIEPDIIAGQVKVTLKLPLRGIAPGQAAVFYVNDYCIGGGTILASIKSS